MAAIDMTAMMSPSSQFALTQGTALFVDFSIGDKVPRVSAYLSRQDQVVNSYLTIGSAYSPIIVWSEIPDLKEYPPHLWQTALPDLVTRISAVVRVVKGERYGIYSYITLRHHTFNCPMWFAVEGGPPISYVKRFLNVSSRHEQMLNSMYLRNAA